MSFAEPMFLWLLWIVPLLLLLLVWSWRQKARLVRQFVPPRLLERLQAGVSPQREKIKLGLFLLALIALIVALARPVFGSDLQESSLKGVDIIVAIDTSKSMLAEDVSPDRLTRAKLAALDLCEQTKGDRLGLVAFAGTAFLQCPPSVDKEAFRQSVNALDTTIIPQGGSAVSEAIQTTLESFEKEDAGAHRALVIFTDGEDHDSEVMATVKKALKKNLRIFTVGVGTLEGELIRLKDARGATVLVKDAEGKAVRTRLNEKLLQEVAKEAMGFYVPLRGAKTMETLYQNGLSQVPKVQFTSRQIRQHFHRFQWPLGFAFLCLIAETLIPLRRNVRPVIAVEKAAVRLQKGVAVALFLCLTNLALASTASAFKRYQEGKYEAALEEYSRLLKKDPEEARLHFNAGASAFRDKQYHRSEKAFNAALATEDLKLQEQAYYNLGNTLYYQGEELPDMDEKIEKWEDSVRHFDLALKLDSQDKDALHNRDLVKKWLEILKKQQEESEAQGNKNSKQKRQSKKGKGKQGGQSNESENGEPQNNSDQEKGEKPGLPEAVHDKEEEKKGGRKGEEKEKGTGDEKEKNERDSPGGSSKMTAQQALHLLETQRGEEKALIFLPANKTNRTQRIFKDW